MTTSGWSGRLLVVGNIAIDLVAHVAQLPAPGEEVVASRTEIVPGGAFHVVRAARGAGLAVAYGGRHGTGPFGDLVRAQLELVEAQHLQPVSTDRDSGWVTVLVEAGGERAFVSPDTAIMPLDSAACGRLTTVPGDLVAISGYLLSTEVAHWARALPADRLLLCDLGPFGAASGAAVLGPLLARVDWLAVNAVEAQAAAGGDDPRQAARMLRSRTDHAGVLVRDGAAGCVVLEPGADLPIRVPAPAVDAVDTNGAGDTHTGWFLAGLAAGRSALEAAQAANAAAARFVVRTDASER